MKERITATRVLVHLDVLPLTPTVDMLASLFPPFFFFFFAEMSLAFSYESSPFPLECQTLFHFQSSPSFDRWMYFTHRYDMSIPTKVLTAAEKGPVEFSLMELDLQPQGGWAGLSQRVHKIKTWKHVINNQCLNGKIKYYRTNTQKSMIWPGTWGGVQAYF